MTIELKDGKKTVRKAKARRIRATLEEMTRSYLGDQVGNGRVSVIRALPGDSPPGDGDPSLYDVVVMTASRTIAKLQGVVWER